MKTILRVLTRRPEAAIVGMLIAAIGVMIIPLPTWLVDFFLAANISASILLVMVAFYLRSAAQFTTLPAVILLATVARLALSIAVTRLILTNAYAGQIIQAFGHLVVHGNIIVGLVIFLIITVVQFVVIAKGAERVAEVAARFMLDALPGKQLAIDADLRNGQLDQDQARARRQELERESHFYGAMDGAMKFVKGDAIAGLVIIVVNLLGGLAVGMLQHGLSFDVAAETYTILTVGDGLVAQIPALLIAVTAGTVVTRIAGSEADNLGAEIILQVMRDSRAVTLGGIVSLILALVPGFPTLVFLAIGGGLLATAWLQVRKARREAEAAPEQEKEDAAEAVAISRLHLALGRQLGNSVDIGELDSELDVMVDRLGARLGIPIPKIRCGVSNSVEPGRFRLDLDGIPMASGSLPEGRLLLRDDRAHAELAAVDVEPCDPAGGFPGQGWVTSDARDRLQQFGVGFAEPEAAIALTIEAILRTHAEELVGIEETKEIVARHESRLAELIREAGRILPTHRMADLLRRLLADGLSISAMRTILEAIVNGSEPDSNNGLYAERIRSALRRQICHSHADSMRVIAAYVVTPQTEATLRSTLRESSQGSYFAIPSETIAGLIERLRQTGDTPGGAIPVVLVSGDLRRHLRLLFKTNELMVPVLAFADILSSFTICPLGEISIPPAGRTQRRNDVVAMNALPGKAGGDARSVA
ncbi:MAG TPA: type III secretion system export apparatus subunit SctV [Acidiphilium sp.]